MSGPKRDLSRRELFDFFRAGKRKSAPADSASGPAAGAAPRPPAPPPPARRLLRPPGALFEDLFADRCASSGACVAACPAQAIFLLPDGPKAGTPVIEARRAPCVVCESLACMSACPTGALVRLGRGDIAMGVAVVDPTHCLPHHGHACTTCSSACPVSGALVLVDGKPQVTSACVGCGVCERVCPTEPVSITVAPTAPL